MNRWRVGEDIGSKETDGCPLTARSVYNNIQRKAVPSLLVPSLPYMVVHVMAEGAIASCGPVPMRPKSVRCC
jgi:hypothetical protein